MKHIIVTQEERQAIQLTMLKEIDDFCKKNNVKYSLSNGTLLGAVRHGGYIPWDDDVDLVMPLPDFLFFKNNFTSANLKYCDIDTEPHFEFAFSRISYLPTFSKGGLISKSYGVNIDLYPVLGLPGTKEGIDFYFSQARQMLKYREKMLFWNRWMKKILPIQTVPGFDRMVRNYKDFLFSCPYEGTNYFFHYGGFIRWSKVFDVDLFENMTEVLFEGYKFSAFENYDLYLKTLYGDYMSLPPEKDRHPYHGGEFYWK